MTIYEAVFTRIQLLNAFIAKGTLVLLKGATLEPVIGSLNFAIWHTITHASPSKDWVCDSLAVYNNRIRIYLPIKPISQWRQWNTIRSQRTLSTMVCTEDSVIHYGTNLVSRYLHFQLSITCPITKDFKYSRYHGRNGSPSLRALKAKRQQQMPVAGLS